MANAYEVIPAPGFWTGPEYTNPEILYSANPAPVMKGVTIAGGTGVIAAGTVMARNSTTKKWGPYANGGANGMGTPVGVLRTAVDATGTRDVQGNVVLGGYIKLNALVGMDSAAITALNGTTNAAMGFFKF